MTVVRVAATAILAVVLGLASCGGHGDGDRAATCACTPTARPSTKLVALLRRHQAAVADGHRNGRDTKLIDDEIRAEASIACEPCGGWVGERALPEELFPLDHLYQAVAATCVGLQLRDGTVAYGEAHPAECAAK